jgi:hypothetical protein
MRGERKLNAELTRLEDDLASSRDKLHLRPANLQRVVETAFDLNKLPPMERVASDRTDVPLFRLPSLSSAWEPVTRGLYTRLDPTTPRAIAFDPKILKQDTNVVYMHLGSPLLQRTTRRLRSALWGGDASLQRVSAMVVPELDESFAVAVTRLVLVGGAGLRLHEEVFLAGTRLARRQAVGRERAEELLEQALDHPGLEPVPALVAEQLARAWNDTAADGIQSRVLAAIDERTARRRSDVEAQLSSRKQADRSRVIDIFERFSTTLRDALARAEAIDDNPQLSLFDDERRQSERDLREIRRRIETLSDERQRELDAVERRYEDARAWEFPAAVVFALAQRDVQEGVVIR